MLALAFSLLALTAPATKPPVIAPEEAASHLEQHVIVLTEKRAYDFYASAKTAADLQELLPVVQYMINSAQG